MLVHQRVPGLENVYITMEILERSTILNGEINYFDWAIFKFANCKRLFTRGYMDLASGHPTKAMENADFMDIPWNWKCRPHFGHL